MQDRTWLSVGIAEYLLRAGLEVLLPHPKHNPLVPETMMCQELDQTKLFINQQLDQTPHSQTPEHFECTNHSSLPAAAPCQDLLLREAQAHHQPEIPSLVLK